MYDIDGLNEKQQTALLEMLWDSLKKSKEHKDRRVLGGGHLTKTKEGLLRSINAVFHDKEYTLPPTDFATQTKICDAFKTSKTYRGLDVHHINAVSEHDQWWIIATLNEGNDPDQRTYSVVEAEGGDSVDGYDFEEV